MEEDGNEGTIGVETACRKNGIEIMLVVSLAVKLENVDRAGSVSNNEFINLLHPENFNLSVFLDIINSTGDCQFITQDVMYRCEDCWAHFTSAK